MIAALFVECGGAYCGLEGVDSWCKGRDARKYAGPYPVIAHPPCGTWCQLAPINQKRYGIRIGADEGCFNAALRAVRTFGGVLEHPARSRAWPAFDLPRPVKGQWSFDGIAWVTEVAQRAYGHPARKLTWLYYVGAEAPPQLDWSVPEPEAQISFCKNHGNSPLPRLSRRAASATPPAFRDLLISIASRAGRKNAA